MFCLHKVYHNFVRIMSNLKYYKNISTSSKSSDLRVKAQNMLTNSEETKLTDEATAQLKRIAF